MKFRRLVLAALLAAVSFAGVHVGPDQSGGGVSDWSDLTGIPAGFADGIDDETAAGGSVPSAQAEAPIDGTTACTNVNELNIATNTCAMYRCTNSTTDTWVRVGIDSDCDGIALDAAVAGAGERDEVLSYYDAIVDCNGDTEDACLGEYYGALESVIAAANPNTALPYRVLVTGNTADFGEADMQDFGDAKVAFALMRSNTYSGGRPTLRNDSTSVLEGQFEVEFKDFTIHHSATDGASADQTEPHVAFMLGSGYFVGHVDGSSALQNGHIPKMRLKGEIDIVLEADLDSGHTVPQVAPTVHFDNATHHSATTTIGFWWNSAPGVDASDLHISVAGIGTDTDDICFVAELSFSSTLGSIRCNAINGPQFLVGSQAMAVGSIETTCGGGTCPFGYAQGTARGDIVPVDGVCLNIAAANAHCASSGNPTACCTGAGTGTCTGCTERVSYSTGPTVAQLVTQSYTMGNLIVFTGAYASDLNGIWTEGAVTNGDGTMLGAGVCSADGSVCTLDADCPSATCDSVPNVAQFTVSLNGSLEDLAIGPSASNPSAVPYDEKRGQIKLSGYYATFPAVPRIHPSADQTVDTSDLASQEPLQWPSTYAGLYVPQVGFTYHATDCTALTQGTLGTYCRDRDNNALWACEPANGGTSAGLCDAVGDWEAISGGGGGDITAVGPMYSTGSAFTDGAVTASTEFLTIEGSAVDNDEYHFLVGGASEPTSDTFYVFPDEATTHNLCSDASLGCVTSSVILDDTIASADILAGTIATSDLANNSVDGTKFALGTQSIGNLMCYDGTDWVQVATGATGEVLSGNTGSCPTWDTAGVGSGDITLVGDCTTGDCFVTGGTGTLIQSDADLTFQVDANTGGTNTFNWKDGAGATIASMDEAGVLTVNGLSIAPVEIPLLGFNDTVDADASDEAQIIANLSAAADNGDIGLQVEEADANYYTGVRVKSTAGAVTTDLGDVDAGNYWSIAENTGAMTPVGNAGMTLDAEHANSTVTIPFASWLPVAGCNNATASLLLDAPASNAAAAACITGTNTQKGVADFDTTTDESLQFTYKLPSDWAGAIDVNYKWLAAATTGSVTWCLQLICVADAETDDPAFPAQASGNCVSDAAKGTTLQTNDAADTGITATGCAAGELMHGRISRDPDATAGLTDDMAGDGRLIGIELTTRRAM